MDDYIAIKAGRGQPTNDLIRRSRVWITPQLGPYAVRELTAERLNDWFSFIGSAPAMKRTRKGAPPQFKPAPTTPGDQIRARRNRQTAGSELSEGRGRSRVCEWQGGERCRLEG